MYTYNIITTCVDAIGIPLALVSGMNTIVCTILWIDKRDRNGIAIDENGNEYYFDVSSCKRRELPLECQLIRGEVQVFGNTPCLTGVRDFLDIERV